MRKLSLAAIGMYLSILSAFAQNTGTDSTAYKSRKLTFEEVNFVAGYYKQDGNNSAVTGGIGTEHLNDIANTIELKLSKYDSRQRKHSYAFEIGVDHYTSASSDKIDPYTISSPSHADTRIYPSASWTVKNEAKGTSIGLNGSLSYEFDYLSLGIGTSFTKNSKDNNREFSTHLQAYFDQWSVIYPIELRTGGGGRSDDGVQGHSPRNSYSASLALSQVINKNLQLVLVAEPTLQNGLLATKYQRVYFTNGAVNVENLPDSRTKTPLGIRANYFFGDNVILRSLYRYYQDNWGVKAHTIELESPIKITPFVSLSPFYRYYKQDAADYFAPYKAHTSSETFYTSDYDLSAFNSHYFGAGIRLAPPAGVFSIQHLANLEIRYGHYNRSNGLNSDQVSLALKFK